MSPATEAGMCLLVLDQTLVVCIVFCSITCRVGLHEYGNSVQLKHFAGVSRSYHESSSSRRSGGTSDRSWNGSSGGPSLLSGPSSELFSGAAVQAAGMMMSAAMSRGSGTTNGASSR